MLMTNKLTLPVESRMQGDLHVRFGGRLWETYHRKVVRRPSPSLRDNVRIKIIAISLAVPTGVSVEFAYRLPSDSKEGCCDQHPVLFLAHTIQYNRFVLNYDFGKYEPLSFPHPYGFQW